MCEPKTRTLSGSEFTPMRPPTCSTILLQIDNLNLCHEQNYSISQNGQKSVSVFLLRYPTRICHRYISNLPIPQHISHSVIFPEGVNLKALFTKLEITCRNRFLSLYTQHSDKLGAIHKSTPTGTFTRSEVTTSSHNWRVHPIIHEFKSPRLDFR